MPDRAGIVPMTPDQAAAAVASLPGWTLDPAGTRLLRRYAFADFAGAFALVGRIAALAEEACHHPDLAFGWGYVTVSLHTHAIGGLHQDDVALAARIERIAR